MSLALKVNEVQMKKLFGTPVTNEIRRKAEQVVEDAKVRAAHIMWRHPIVTNSIAYRIEADGSAVIGIHDGEDGERFLAEKEERENVWLTPAVRRAFPYNRRSLFDNGR